MRQFSTRLLAFLLLFAVLYFALAQAWNAGLSRWVIDFGTVQPAAWLARQLCGDESIVADGSRLASARASVNVLFGCEGTDVSLLLVAAMLAAPATWRDRALGLLAGLCFVFVVNQARLLALFFALRDRRSWFGPLHGLVAPLAVVVAVSAFFLGWLRWTRGAARTDAPDG
jgi:exosortase/archaeosortase family protein